MCLTFGVHIKSGAVLVFGFRGGCFLLNTIITDIKEFSHIIALFPLNYFTN